MGRTAIRWAREKVFRQVDLPGAPGVHPLIKCGHRDQTERRGWLSLAIAMDASPQLLHVYLGPWKVLPKKES